MKTLPISRYRFFQKIQPLSLLKKITSKSVTGCLQVFSTSGAWSIYIDEGKLIYACYSEKMFEPLYRNLHRLSEQISTLPNGIDDQLKAIFETGAGSQAIPNPDYLAICWLVNQKYISAIEAAVLIEQLALEVLESFLNLEEGSYEFIPESFLDDMPKFCHLNLRLLVERCQKRGREGFYQETSHHTENKNTQAPINYPGLRSSFAQHLEEKRWTQPLPFSQPKPHPQPKPEPQLPKFNRFPSQPANPSHHNYQPNAASTTEKKVYTIFCIDNSTAILNLIKNALDEQIFSVAGVTDSFKALIEVLRIKPDIILLNVDMADLDGYELCTLLRKHAYFKNTPIIMVTEKASLINRAKAKLARASGYLTQPFTQGDLMKIIFQHIV
ncbi:response regulator [Nostoc sp. FACHB-110]|uniref:response regulator n=1 Tax=Nostoc sp. FACHB-110 TaxID=2692834 RepID=UPI0016846C41|nr:response regulator [Nostoc sp. FACHB-110]MBD2438512.1 response regulator [Nostoc sp. FACHB-110]